MGNLHQIQMLILRELLFKPSSKFSELNIQGLSNDHFSYHIKYLTEQGFVIKKSLKYILTTKGKEYANMMDTEDSTIEKQPKVGVMLVVIKIKEGKRKFLIQERTKEPYFGYQGFLTGKVRFGEKFLETARRELKEETGLECSNFDVKNIVHNHVRMSDTGELLEDKIFIIVVANNPTGKIIDTRSGKNRWITEEQFRKLEKKYYDEDSIFDIGISNQKLNISEDTFFVNEF